MTSVLRDLEAQYAARAQAAALEAAIEPEAAPKRRATRTYSGDALEKRRAWGRLWGGMNAEHARKLRAGEVG